MTNKIVIFKELTTEEKLQEIELQSEKFKGLVVDMRVDADRKKVKDSAKVINDILKKADRFRIDESARLKGCVESEFRHISDRLTAANAPLTALTDKYKADCKAIADKEKERCAIVESAFTAINNAAMEAIGQTSTVIETIIDDMESYEFHPDVLRSRTDEFVKNHIELMAKLNSMLEGQVVLEKMQAQQAEFEAMKEAQRVQLENEARAKRDAEIAEDARIEANKRHEKQLIENAERERLATIEREKRMAIDKKEAEERAIKQAEQAAQFERDKIAAEQAAEQARKDTLEANKRHVGAVRREIKKMFMSECGIDETTAKKVVLSLLKTQRITINY